MTRARLGLGVLLGLLGELAPGCRAPAPRGAAASAAGPVAPVAVDGHPASAGVVGGPAAALPVERIAIVGASVSAGFGGTPFGEAFVAAAPRSTVESYASLYLFRDPIGDTRAQLERARAHRPTALFAIDLLFWDVYGSPDPAWRERALAAALDELERARAAGAWIVLGDVPLVATAAEWMLPRDRVPDRQALGAINARIAAWAARDRVLLVPFAAWTAPLVTGEEIELGPGERVPARSLVTIDGLHANPLGTWYLLDRLDHLIEARLPGTPRDALLFTRPAP